MLGAVCFHCGLPADPRCAYPLQGELKPFCCLGCQAAAETIVNGGLGEFYRFRGQASVKASVQTSAYTLYDSPEVQADFVTPTPAGLRQARLHIGGISCAACVWLIEKHLAAIKGVHQVRVNSTHHTAWLEWHPEQVPLSTLFSALAAIGFNPLPQGQAQRLDYWQAQQKTALLRLGLAGISMMQAGMVAVGLYAGALQGLNAHWEAVLRGVTFLFALPVVFYSAMPFYRNAFRALQMRQLNMDVSVSLGLILAFFASCYALVTHSGEVYFESLSMFVFILLAGRFLEQRVRFRNFQHSASLQSLLPATLIRCGENGQPEEIPLRSLQVKDTLWVAPGAVFPCDGVVLEGQGTALEAIISGEAHPQAKQPGSPVVAGTHNGETRLRIEVTATGADTQLAHIEQVFEQAASARPKQLTLVDRLASHFVAAVLAVSAVTWLVWHWLEPARALWVTLSVLVVTCPCALSLATPAALVAGLARLRRLGLLVSSPDALETLSRVSHVVFDKTGTLTQGQLSVQQWLPLADTPEASALAIIAALESLSAHPIAQAFAPYAAGLSVSQGQVVPAMGVQGVIHGQLYRFGNARFAWPQQPPPYPGAGQWQLLASQQQPLAWVLLSDALRPSSGLAVQQLQAQGKQVWLLSGDRSQNVLPVAEALKIPKAFGEHSPQQKLTHVKQLQQGGACVLMVGDGINDVPVLGGADVSVAMGAASAITQNRADAILLNNQLHTLPQALLFARRVQTTIRQNLAWALVYNAVALPAAVFGWVPPWLAAVGMASSSLIVVLNALRL